MRFSNNGPTLVVSIDGELDHHLIEFVREKIDTEIMKATTKNLIFDFSKVSFMDSSGIGIIMGRYKKIQQMKGWFALVHVNDQIQRILEMSGVLKVIPVYDSIESAINRS